MNSTVTASLLLSLLAIAARPDAVSQQPASPLHGNERAVLRSLEDAELLERRAGSPGTTIPLDELERAELRLLERQELETRRAGDLTISDDDLVTILLILGIVALLVIIF